ncbi:MAG: metallopeptidase family protein [Ancalomicrobiaceae bacterium]|nr:metallopeptidase family protein [Ancalomicrobiaceae bacterium]
MKIDWTHLKAASLDDFETIASSAYRQLPAEFRRLTGDIVIRVAEFPDDDVIDEMELESEFDILGLFQGVGLGHGSAVPMTGQMPNLIWLYRRPILDYWAENDETLGAIIVHVLIHEIGHHFGLSDDDIDAIEAAAG